MVAMRPHNGLICGLVLLAGWPQGMVAGGGWGLAAALAVVLLCSAAHLVNDLVDLPADRRNRPGRPLPSGYLTPRVARNGALTSWLLGLGLGLVSRPDWWGWWLFWALAGPGYSLSLIHI